MCFYTGTVDISKEKTVDSDGERLQNLKFDSFQF